MAELNPVMWAGLYRTSRAYDKAVELVSEAVRNVGNDNDDLEKFFRQKITSSRSEEQFFLCSAAFNMASIASLFANGRTQEAEKRVRVLVERETLYHVLSDSVKDFFSRSFAELCISKRKLLAPSQLDAVILDEYSENPQETRKYLEKPGVAIAVPNLLIGSDVYLIFSKSQTTEVDHKPVKNLFCVLSLEKDEFHHNPGDRDMNDLTRERFQKHQVDSYDLVRARDENLFSYLGFRFSVEKIGGTLYNQVKINGPLNPGFYTEND